MSELLFPGYHDPVFQSQAAFRAILNALARPGALQTLAPLPPGAALPDALQHALLTLTDSTTPVWWQQPNEQLQEWLAFHTGAVRSATAQGARFAVVTDVHALGSLTQFAQGSDSAPDESTTLLVQLPRWDAHSPLSASGPGIREHVRLCLPDLGEAFWQDWHEQSGQFPRGVDVLFCCDNQVLGLPRTTRVQRTLGD